MSVRSIGIFGDYVSIYDLQQPVEGGATVSLYCENRTPELEPADPELHEQKCGAVFEHIDESYPENGAGIYGLAVQPEWGCRSRPERGARGLRRQGERSLANGVSVRRVKAGAQRAMGAMSSPSKSEGPPLSERSSMLSWSLARGLVVHAAAGG